MKLHRTDGSRIDLACTASTVGQFADFPFMLILTLLFLAVFAFSCIDYWDLSDNQSEAYQDEDASGDPWEDTTSGLVWQKDSTCCYDWNEAKSYCQNLNWGGYTDWRLPTISEFRSLIRGCEATETNGSCQVTDSCLDSSCLDSSCNGCAALDGEGEEGMYWPPELNGECCWYWSISAVGDDSDNAWIVYFETGGIKFSYVFDYYAYVRCVR